MIQEKRQIIVPLELIELIGKEKVLKICKELFEKNNDEPLMEEYNKAEKVFAFWQNLGIAHMTKQSDRIKAYNKEYFNIKIYY